MTQRRLRVVILGGGMVAEVHRRAAVLAGAEVIGVLASTPTRSVEVATRWGVQRGFVDLADVLRSNPDVVHVCTPNSLHREHALAALRDGRNVICEKPLGVSSEEARELADVAAQSGLVTTIPFIYRYHPLVREIKARSDAGHFGRWLLAHGSYLQDWLLSPETSNWRVDPTLGGPSRAVADIGTHWFDLVEWVSGIRFESVLASTAVLIPDRIKTGTRSFGRGVAGSPLVAVETEDAAVILLRSSSSLGSVTLSQVSAGRKNRLWFELDGTLGSACFDQEQPETVWLGNDAGARVIARGAGNSAEEQRLSVLPAGHSQGYAQCFEAFIADTYAAIQGTTRPGLPTFEDGQRAARFVDAVLSSNTTEQWTEIAQ